MPKLLILNLIFELIFLRVIRNIYIIKFYMQFAVINFMPILLKVFHIYQSLYIYPLIYVISLIWYHSIHLYITCTLTLLQGSNCCSQFLISFHHVDTGAMIFVHQLLYRTSVYGRNLPQNIPSDLFPVKKVPPKDVIDNKI